MIDTAAIRVRFEMLSPYLDERSRRLFAVAGGRAAGWGGVTAVCAATGLEVRCCLDENDYPKGIKVSNAETDAINISRDEFHGEWNYTIAPMLTVPDEANRPVASFEVEG